jgi:hypothetical protein
MTFNLVLDASQIKGDIAAVASRVIKKVTYDVQATIVTRIQTGPKTGRLYRRRDKKTGRIRLHRASAPGESPATDHGFLIGSVQVPPFVDPLVGEILVSADYAAYLEQGAPRAHLEPRPFIRPAIEDVIRRAQAGIG